MDSSCSNDANDYLDFITVGIKRFFVKFALRLCRGVESGATKSHLSIVKGELNRFVQ